MSLVLNHSRAIGTDKVVMLGIANHDGDGGSWPSLATLARYANVSSRSVSAALARLVILGELIVLRNQGGNHKTDPRHRPNRYEIAISPGTKPTASLKSPRVEAERVQATKPTSTEPSLEPSTSKSSTDLRACRSRGVGIPSDDARRAKVASEYARLAHEQATTGNYRIKDPTAYRASKTAFALRHRQIDEYLERWPTAPADAIASWMHGDKHSMSYWPEVTP